MFDSISVDPYDTNVESCVGNDSDALRLPLSRCRVSVLARLTVYGFSFSGFVSSISGDVGILLSLLLRCDVVFLGDCYYCYYYLMKQFLLFLDNFRLQNLVRVVDVVCTVGLV